MPTDRSIAAFRWALVSCAVVLFATVATTLLRVGGAPTDENLFTTIPSPAYLTARVAPSVLQDAEGRPASGEIANGLAPGDLLVGAGGQRVRTLAQVAEAAASPPRDGFVEIQVARLSKDREFVARIRADALRTLPLRDVRGAALVIDVQPGGASDRAGMRRGDVIVSINGQRFSGATQADQIMRAAVAGRPTAYDVLRDGDALTLQVVLASFGLRLTVLATVATGLCWMVFGLFLGLARPRFTAARLLAIRFVGIGFLLTIVFLRPAVSRHPFELLRDTVAALAFFAGFGALTHACYYFPREKPELLASGRRVALAYLVAAVGAVIAFVLLASGRTSGVPAVIAIVMLVHWFTRWRVRRHYSPEERAILRPIRWAFRLAVAGVIASVAVGLPREFRGPGYGFALLAAVPLAYLWTIGQYRLFDLDLRVRRAVQYSIASWAWGALALVVLVRVLVWLPSAHLPLPNVRFTGGAVELLEQPLSPGARQAQERVVLMIVAIGLAFLFRAIARSGQRWLATKFYRTAYDYRRASRELAELIASRLDLEGLADGLIETLCGLMPLDRAGVIFVHDHRRYCGSRARGMTPEDWQRFCATAADDVLLGASRATGEVNAEYVFPRLRRLLEAAGIRHLYPLLAHDKPVGVLLVGDKLSETAFDADDFEFLGAVARQIAPAVDNAFLYEELAGQERLKHELAIARRIQLESLPQHTPRVEGLDIAGISIPAMEVGGDYFDYFNGTARRLTVMVGDVSGKGTSAALYMSKLQGILRSLHGFDLTPRELFIRTNQLLCHDLERRSFVTALGGFFDPGQGRMILARAGHLPLYHFESATRAVHRVLPRGLGFGLSSRELFSTELEERLIEYGPGDAFLFITDGITETQSATDDDFGEDRVMELFAREAARGAPAARIRDQVMEAVRSFAVGREQFDDQTVVAVRVVS